MVENAQHRYIFPCSTVDWVRTETLFSALQLSPHDLHDKFSRFFFCPNQSGVTHPEWSIFFPNPIFVIASPAYIRHGSLPVREPSLFLLGHCLILSETVVVFLMLRLPPLIRYRFADKCYHTIDTWSQIAALPQYGCNGVFHLSCTSLLFNCGKWVELPVKEACSRWIEYFTSAMRSHEINSMFTCNFTLQVIQWQIPCEGTPCWSNFSEKCTPPYPDQSSSGIDSTCPTFCALKERKEALLAHANRKPQVW